MSQLANLREHLDTETVEGPDGVLRWTSNGRPVPLHVFEDAGRTPPESQARACEEDLREFVAKYRRLQPSKPSAEEVVEARAAFGEGVEVVDFISGRRFKT